MGSNWLLAEQVAPLKLTYHVKVRQGTNKIFPNILHLSAETET